MKCHCDLELTLDFAVVNFILICCPGYFSETVRVEG